MSFTDTFIKRPVLATVTSLTILLLGVIAYHHIPIRQYPKIDIPSIEIVTHYIGADSKTMESFITSPIENALAGIAGIDYISATNTQGTSHITIHLTVGTDVYKALSDVRDKVSSVRWQLPDAVQDPIINQSSAHGSAILYIAFSSNKLTPESITDYLVRAIQPELQTIDGVSQAAILNNKEYAMRIWLDPSLMAAHHISAQQVNSMLQANNTQTQAGKLTTTMEQLDITAHTSLSQEKAFDQLAIHKHNHHIVRIHDLGQSTLGAKNLDISGYFNGQPAIIIAINPKSSANPLQVAKLVKQRLHHIAPTLKPGLKMQVVWDNAKFINESLWEVAKTIAFATFAVIAVIYLFLGSMRTVLIPTVTIPLSLIGICTFMFLLGYSINTITLLAWILAIGLVVDDAIVVLENIHRHIEPGINATTAATHGTREIRFAIVAMTFTLATVYIPIGFTAGLVGQLFREFAFTLAGCVLISGIISLTLSPMMCTKIFKSQHDNTMRFSHIIETQLSKMTHRYYQALHWVLHKRRLAVIFCILIYGVCALMFIFLPRELAPQEDASHLISFVQGPATANLAYMEKYTHKIHQLYQQVPGYLSDMNINGWPNSTNSSFSLLLLKEHSQRKESVFNLQQQLLRKFMGIPGVFAFPVVPSMLPGDSGLHNVSFVLTTTDSYQTLYKAMQQIITKAEKIPYLFNIDSDLKMNKPSINLDINRDKAADLGISMADISTALNTFLGEPTVSQFTQQGHSYDVIPQLMAQFRNQPEKLNDIYLSTELGKIVPLSNLIKIHTIVEAQSLNHFQQQRSATLTANVWPGKLGTVLKELEDIAKQVLPSNVTYDFADSSRRFMTSSWTMTLTLVYALIFIYLVLAAQFESFRDPFIVLLSVPLAFTGAVMALLLFHGSLNIYTRIGLLTLIGLIAKHGILMVEFANQQRLQGKNVLEAILAAATIRLRPILMTTAAMVLGALPLALARGAGAEVRQQLGWVIVGGMLIGTCFTLFAIPTAYTLFSKRHAPVATTT